MLKQLMAMSTGVRIVLILVFLIVAGALIFLLFLGIRRDHRRLILLRYKVEELRKEEFESLIEQRTNVVNAPPFALLFLEVNGAKTFHDSYGYGYYVEAMSLVKERLGPVLPKKSKLCLYAYDTYAIFIDGEISAQELADLSAKCVLETHKPVPISKKQKEVLDVIIGAANYDDSSMSFSDIMKHVDISLAVSGRVGLNMYMVYSSDLEEYADASHYYRELRDAINENEFTLHFQPIFDIENDVVFAYEALLRWNRSEFGVLRPDRFMYIMERSGDLNWIGLWAFEQLLIARKRHELLYPSSGIIFSMNLSYGQLVDERFCAEIHRLQKKYGIAPNVICFEVGEGALLGKMPEVSENIEKLAQCGFLIAIDNFGLDENSLLHVGNLIRDWVKLDRQFMKKAQENMSQRAFMEQFVSLSQELEFKIIAQGIEDVSMEDFVKSAGIKCAQGYFLGKPARAEDYKF